MTDPVLDKLLRKAINGSQSLFVKYGGHGPLVLFRNSGGEQTFPYYESEHESVEMFTLYARHKLIVEDATHCIYIIPTAFDEVPFTSGDSVAFICVSTSEMRVLVGDLIGGKLGEPYELDEEDAKNFEFFYQIHPTYLLRLSVEVVEQELRKALALLNGELVSRVEIVKRGLTAVATRYGSNRAATSGAQGSAEEHIEAAYRAALVIYADGFIEQFMEKNPGEVALELTLDTLNDIFRSL